MVVVDGAAREERSWACLARLPKGRVKIELAFVNDLCHDLDKAASRRDAFIYGEEDRFPLDSPSSNSNGAALGLLVGDTPEDCAESTAAEIARRSIHRRCRPYPRPTTSTKRSCRKR